MNKHLQLKFSFIMLSLIIAVTGGLCIGAHLVFINAFNYQLGPSYFALIQAHGHLQLIGLTAIFIITISLHKIPRVTSTNPLNSSFVTMCLSALSLSVIFKSTFLILIFYNENKFLLRFAIAILGIVESSSIGLYLYLLLVPVLKYKAKSGAIAAAQIKPFFLLSLAGWAFYAVLNIVLSIDYLYSEYFIFSPILLNINYEVFINLVLLPACFAFSINIFPIFLRLRAPTWNVTALAKIYFFGCVLFILGLVLTHSTFLILGTLIKVCSIAYLIYQLDFFHLRAPWYKKYRTEELNDNLNLKAEKHRENYGNFHWLIYLAYIWLTFGLIAELLNITQMTLLNPSAIRHLYLLGFVMHLILGVAVRLIPGFLGISRIFSPTLVTISLFFILTATIGRIAPLLLPSDLSSFRFLYGWSGVLAMLALCCLIINLCATVIITRKQAC